MWRGPLPMEDCLMTTLALAQAIAQQLPADWRVYRQPFINECGAADLVLAKSYPANSHAPGYDRYQSVLLEETEDGQIDLTLWSGEPVPECGVLSPDRVVAEVLDSLGGCWVPPWPLD